MLPLTTFSCGSITDLFHNHLIPNHDSVFTLDGGTGEELFSRGVPDDRKIWSATAVVHEQYHTVLKDVHKSFLEAGSNSITTNSYGFIPGAGFTDTTEISKYCMVAGKLARDAVNEYRQTLEESFKNNTDKIQQPTYVFGSLGPLLESYRPDKIMNHDEGVLVYSSMMDGLSQYVDAFLAETLSSTDEVAQVIDALSNVSSNNSNNSSTIVDDSGTSTVKTTTAIPLLISLTVNSNGQLRSKEPTPDAIRRIISLANQKSNVLLLAILFNCSEPESITYALESIQKERCSAQQPVLTLLEQNKIVLGAYANRLTPVPENWTMADSDGPQPFRTDLDPVHYHTDFVQRWIKNLNVKLVGGCCGITPDHVKNISSIWKL